MNTNACIVCSGPLMPGLEQRVGKHASCITRGARKDPETSRLCKVCKKPTGSVLAHTCLACAGYTNSVSPPCEKCKGLGVVDYQGIFGFSPKEQIECETCLGSGLTPRGPELIVAADPDPQRCPSMRHGARCNRPVGLHKDHWGYDLNRAERAWEEAPRSDGDYRSYQ